MFQAILPIPLSRDACRDISKLYRAVLDANIFKPGQQAPNARLVSFRDLIRVLIENLVQFFPPLLELGWRYRSLLATHARVP
jgi:hypothetical protein